MLGLKKMKIAVISDIHSNFFYFKNALAAFKNEAIQLVFCLGDLIGYYDSPNEVIDLCRANNIQSVKGNHEKYILGEITYDLAKEHLYRIQRQSRIISKENLEYLRKLPDFIEVTLQDKKFYLTHSLPNDCISYCYDICQLDKTFIVQYDYYCFGHTHLPLMNYHFGTCLINPGSVGQPRDYTQKPSFAIVDLASGKNILQQLRIEIAPYLYTLETQGFDQTLIDILRRTNNSG